ncbi:MAG: tetratricopeptide repeat protein [Bacteroidales bacterium]|nr:tetratricopeptide repeat protein [Bacteroidales bacterium]
MRKFLCIYAAALLTSFSLSAQDVRTRLDQAKTLYNKGMYVTAEKELDQIAASMTDHRSLLYSEVVANKVMCAIALGRADMEGLLKNFENEFPADPQLDMIKFSLGSYWFDNANYEPALDVFNQIKTNHLYKSVRNEYYFKRGYCSMRVGNYEQSVQDFSKVFKSSANPYSTPSRYYCGYVHYLNKDFDRAFSCFEKTMKDKRFAANSGYYACECRFMQKEYDYVIDYGPDLYERLSPELKANLARMVSESYFAKNDNYNAKKHLDLYLSGAGEVSRKDSYYAGVLSYSMGSYPAAIEAFKPVVSDTDEIGQSAYYYSANSYLKHRNKLAALKCFQSAASCDFDKEIKEDAMFNFAKLSFDVNQDISQFEKYAEAYPSSGKEDVINTYMSASFLLQKDYQAAIDLMRKIKNPTPDVERNLQKAYLYRAAALMDNGGYSSAADLLQEAISLDASPQVTNLANYCLAECYFRNENYDHALQIDNYLLRNGDFKNYDEYRLLPYNIGYAAFKKEDFETAVGKFNEFVENGAGDLDKDARLRLGDAYFLQGLYKEAAGEYEQVETRYHDGDIYASYQRAMAFGLMGEDKNKIEILARATADNSSADLYNEAMYELGLTYMQNGKGGSASDCFKILLSAEDSSYFVKSLLQLALVNSNEGRYNDAISYYDRIIREAPLTAEVQDAITGLESIYQMQGRPSEFIEYLDKAGLSSVRTAGEKEMMVFAAAEQTFFAGNYPSAVNALQSFLDQYPTGAKTSKAYYYLAESLKATGRREAACDAYFQAMKGADDETAASAALNYADICYSLGHYRRAVEAYETLSGIAGSQEVKDKAVAGKLLALYNSRQYTLALTQAKSVIDGREGASGLLRTAKYVAAKTNVVLGERDNALPYLKELAADPSDEYGAESAYLLIQNFYESGDFSSVERNVYSFSDSGSGQLYWLAKSFIILGDSFADREEFRQAKATYESIRDGYKPQRSNDDVQDQIKLRLEKINSMEK